MTKGPDEAQPLTDKELVERRRWLVRWDELRIDGLMDERDDDVEQEIRRFIATIDAKDARIRALVVAELESEYYLDQISGLMIQVDHNESVIEDLRNQIEEMHHHHD